MHFKEMSGKFNFFSRSGNFVMHQGKIKFCRNVREFYISVCEVRMFVPDYLSC